MYKYTLLLSSTTAHYIHQCSKTQSYFQIERARFSRYLFVVQQKLAIYTPVVYADIFMMFIYAQSLLMGIQSRLHTPGPPRILCFCVCIYKHIVLSCICDVQNAHVMQHCCLRILYFKLIRSKARFQIVYIYNNKSQTRYTRIQKTLPNQACHDAIYKETIFFKQLNIINQ